MTNPRAAYLPDMPPEWATIPDEIITRLVPSGGYTTPEQQAELNRIAAGRWFLVRNELRARCGACRQGTLPGAIHEYLTIACVEAPFNGLREVVLFMQSHEHGDLLFSGLSAGTIVPITAERAAQFNRRIRQHGGVPINAQQPIRANEIDPIRLSGRLTNNARFVRDNT